MKSILFSKKILLAFALLCAFFGIAVIALTKIPIEKSFQTILKVDEEDSKKLIVDANTAYKMQNISKIILRYGHSTTKTSILGDLNKEDNNFFSFEVFIDDTALIKGSTISAWVIYGYGSLISAIADF